MLSKFLFHRFYCFSSFVLRSSITGNSNSCALTQLPHRENCNDYSFPKKSSVVDATANKIFIFVINCTYIATISLEWIIIGVTNSGDFDELRVNGGILYSVHSTM